MTKWCVIFYDGSGRSLLGRSKEDIRQRYQNVKCVFKMGINHNKGV